MLVQKLHSFSSYYISFYDVNSVGKIRLREVMKNCSVYILKDTEVTSHNRLIRWMTTTVASAAPCRLL